MPHDHAGEHTGSHGFGLAFAIGVALNAAYVVIEAVAGFGIHSVALLADAGHNLGDVIALSAAWLAAWLGMRTPTGQYTYGLRRASILAALANAIILLVVTGGIGWAAIERLITPEPTGGGTIIVVAVAGIVVNGVTALLFMRGRGQDLNIRAAFMHMAADASLAAGVAIAGAVILLTGWLRVDPAVSLVISAVIVAGTWGLLRNSVKYSLDAVPPGISQEQVSLYLRSLPGVVEVHDLHIWGMSTTETALTAHLVRMDARDDDDLLHQITHEVRERFNICHATVQLETPEHAHACELRPDHVV